MGIVGAVLGLIVGLFVLAWTQGLFGGATDKVDEAQTIALIGEVRGNVKEGWYGQPTYGASVTDLVPDLRRMGKLPAGSDTGSGMESPYGTMTVRGHGRLFQIELRNLDSEACYNIGRRFARGAGDSSVVNLQASGSTHTSTVARAASQLVQVADLHGSSACGTNQRNRFLAITFR